MSSIASAPCMPPTSPQHDVESGCQGRTKGPASLPRGRALHLQDSITHGVVLKVEFGGFQLQTGLPGRPKALRHLEISHTQLIRLIKEQELRIPQVQAGDRGYGAGTQLWKPHKPDN